MLKAQKDQRAAAKVIARQRTVTRRVDELATEGDDRREAGNLDEAAADALARAGIAEHQPTLTSISFGLRSSRLASLISSIPFL